MGGSLSLWALSALGLYYWWILSVWEGWGNTISANTLSPILLGPEK